VIEPHHRTELAQETQDARLGVRTCYFWSG
jgi:hypothetical protein